MWPVLCSEKLDSHDHLFLKKKKKKEMVFKFKALTSLKKGFKD